MKKFDLSILLLFFVFFVNSQSRKAHLIFADAPDISVVYVVDTYCISSIAMHLSLGIPIAKSNNLIDWEIVNFPYGISINIKKKSLNNKKNVYGRDSWASSIGYHISEFYIPTFSRSTNKTYIYITDYIENCRKEIRTAKPSPHDFILRLDNVGKYCMIYRNEKLFIT